MKAPLDFIAICAPGLRLRTRDRSEAVITRVDAGEGLVHGEVAMLGPCVWRRDGVYRDAPFGAPGPLDLMAPATQAEVQHKQVSTREALAADNRTFCCD